jgi:hypothetical protein
MPDIQPHILTLLTSAEHTLEHAITAFDDATTDLHYAAYRNLHHVGDEPQDCALEVDNVQSAVHAIDAALDDVRRVRRLAALILRTQ